MSPEEDERPEEAARDETARDTADAAGTHGDADLAQEQVRALLAAAVDPADEQVPEDVAGRLDDVLAGLVSERADRGATVGEDAADGPGHPVTEAASPAEHGTPGTAKVTDLTSRRRRRWVQGLAAAAAVSAVGVGLGTVLADSNGDGSAASSGVTAESGAAADSMGGASEQDAETPDEGAAAEPGVAPRSQEPRPDTKVRVLPERPPRLRTGSLTVEVQRIEDFVLAVPVAESERAWRQACVRPSTGPGDAWLPVLLDGERGVLLLRAPAGGRRTAQVYTCGHPARPAAETTVESR